DHAVTTESFGDSGAHRASVEATDAAHRVDRARDVIDDEARHPLVHHLRYGATPARNDRRSARHRLDHRKAERFGEFDEMEEREGGTEQLVALGRAERAHEADAVTIDVGCYFPVEIVPIVNDARDYKRKPDRLRYRDRVGHAPVGVEAAETDKHAAGVLPRSEPGGGDDVIK